jgi:transposase-like protein
VEETVTGRAGTVCFKNPSTQSKIVVLGMLRRNGEVRAMHVPHTRVEDTSPIIDKHVSPDAIIFSDQSNVHRTLDKKFAGQEVVNHTAKEYVRGIVRTNSIEGFWCHMKRGINGIYHHVSKQHLQRYTDEYVYRYNTRHISDPDRFEKCLREIEGRLTYKKLIDK